MQKIKYTPSRRKRVLKQLLKEKKISQVDFDMQFLKLN